MKYEDRYERRLKAATQVIEDAYASGTFALDPRETARKMLHAADGGAGGHTFDALMKDGGKVKVYFEDKGDFVPGFDEKQNRYEALTSFIKFTFEDQRHEGQPLMSYVQVDKWKAEDSGDVAAFREKEDLAAMDSMGLDLTSIPEFELPKYSH